jgi:hypothetical protein
MDMDGNVLEALFREDWRESHPIYHKGKKSKSLSLETKEELSPEEMEMVKKRLRNLGYLD